MNWNIKITMLTAGLSVAAFFTSDAARATGNPSQTYCLNSQVTCYDDLTVFGFDVMDYTVAQTGNPAYGTETGTYSVNTSSGRYEIDSATLCGGTWVYSGFTSWIYAPNTGATGVICPGFGRSSEGWGEYYWTYP